MKLSSKVSELTAIIEPAVKACGVRLWGVEFAPQGRRSLLRIYIDATAEQQAQDKRVTIEDCAAVNHQVSGVLEVHDPIAGEYTLEVSSPGFDRPFFYAEQLQEYIDHRIEVRLIHGIDDNGHKRRKLIGRLQAVNNAQLQLKLDDDNTISANFDNIDKAHLIYQDAQ